MPQAMRNLISMAFVEPNADFGDLIWGNVARLPSAGHKSIVHAMITDECPSENTTMYRFTRKGAAEFGVSWEIVGTWMGMEEEYPLVALDAIMHQKVNLPGGRPMWEAFSQAAHKDRSYVEPVLRTCLTPLTLLAKLGVSSSELCMVVIDAERTDIKIVNEFLEDPGFGPGWLQFEMEPLDWPTKESQDIVWRLQHRGYSVGMSLGGSSVETDKENVYAVLEG
mmetsp:Transcript_36456/g.84817  ORF Transcript_36456/g.84817 Transcript_36456/m.84817 type:complete len:223 (+) Transcript_36456:285-953(+)